MLPYLTYETIFSYVTKLDNQRNKFKKDLNKKYFRRYSEKFRKRKGQTIREKGQIVKEKILDSERKRLDGQRKSKNGLLHLDFTYLKSG